MNDTPFKASVTELWLNNSAGLFLDDTASVTLVLICYNDPFIFLLIAEELPRENVRGSAEEARPSFGGALRYPAHPPSAITAPTLSTRSGGLSQPQQEKKELRPGKRLNNDF